MKLRLIGAVAVVCALALSATAANARKAPRHDSAVASQCEFDQVCPGSNQRIQGRRIGSDAHGNDSRPRAWCGWWMRQELGVADRAGNLARWWARFGTNAHGPAVGAIMVWPHHVGIITAQTSTGGFVVKSGNDGHAVRERERSLRGAIAFRWPTRIASR